MDPALLHWLLVISPGSEIARLNNSERSESMLSDEAGPDSGTRLSRLNYRIKYDKIEN